MKAKELEKQFDEAKKQDKERIRALPKRKRFWAWIKYLLIFPFKWIWVNLRDFRSMIIFGIVCAVVSCEVWIPYIFGVITGNKWWFGVGSTLWLWWLMPGTPFLPLCIVLTIGIKAIFNKLRRRNDN